MARTRPNLYKSRKRSRKRSNKKLDVLSYENTVVRQQITENNQDKLSYTQEEYATKPDYFETRDKVIQRINQHPHGLNPWIATPSNKHRQGVDYKRLKFLTFIIKI